MSTKTRNFNPSFAIRTAKPQPSHAQHLRLAKLRAAVLRQATSTAQPIDLDQVEQPCSAPNVVI